MAMVMPMVMAHSVVRLRLITGRTTPRMRMLRAVTLLYLALMATFFMKAFNSTIHCYPPLLSLF